MPHQKPMITVESAYSHQLEMEALSPSRRFTFHSEDRKLILDSSKRFINNFLNFLAKVVAYRG